jgi:serine/threonine protein kinase
LFEALDIDHPADANTEYVACSSAFSDADLFHRDISLGNTMIADGGEGKLNDWDLCREVHVDKSLEGPHTVTGFPHLIALVLMSIYRVPGSSSPPDCLRILVQDTLSLMISNHTSSS